MKRSDFLKTAVAALAGLAIVSKAKAETVNAVEPESVAKTVDFTPVREPLTTALTSPWSVFTHHSVISAQDLPDTACVLQCDTPGVTVDQHGRFVRFRASFYGNESREVTLLSTEE